MFRRRRKTKVSPIELGLPLASLAVRTEAEDEHLVEAILRNSNLSRERVRGELWLLRSIAVELGIQLTFGGHDELTHALWACYFGFLVHGASEAAHLSKVATALHSVYSEKFSRTDPGGWTKIMLNGSQRWGTFAYEPRRGQYRAAMQAGLNAQATQINVGRFYNIGKEFGRNLGASDDLTVASIGAREWQSTEEATSALLANYEISRDTVTGPLKIMASGKEAENAFNSRGKKPR
jgi:hypothetical protein